MTLKSSEVIFQALEPLQPQWPLQPPQPQWPQWPQQPHFIKKFTQLDRWIIPSTQMTNTSPFLWNGSSKIQFFTKIGNISVGGWWGQSVLLFWKLVVMPKNIQSQHSKSTFKQNPTCIFLSVRVNLKETFQSEIPCSWNGETFYQPNQVLYQDRWFFVPKSSYKNWCLDHFKNKKTCTRFRKSRLQYPWRVSCHLYYISLIYLHVLLWWLHCSAV